MSLHESLLHPYAILKFLVQDRLPRIASQDSRIAQYYQDVLNNPVAAIEKCCSLLCMWVVEMFEAGTLWDAQALREHEVRPEDIPRQPGCYVWVILLPDDHRFYAGQSKDLQHRTIKCHANENYRRNHSSLAYTFAKHAVDSFFVLPIIASDLTDGPLKNILEQLIAVVFRSLQFEELEDNLPAGAFEMIPSEHLDLGANLAEPLAQGLPLCCFPGRTGKRDFGPGLESSNDPLKREYAVTRKTEIREQSEKRHRFLVGHPFRPPPFLPKRPLPTGWVRIVNGKIKYPHDPAWPPKPPSLPPGVGRFVRWQWGNNHSDYQFYINNVKIWVPRADVDRLIEDTIRIFVDISPGGRHPKNCVTVTDGEGLVLDDPGFRLGLRLHGTFKGDHSIPDLQGNYWLKIHGKSSIEKANSLFDWISGLDVSPEHPRPRRWYTSRDILADGTVGYREWTT